MFNLKIFAQRVSEQRQLHNLSLEELGNIVDVRKQTIWKIEKGERAASIELICLFADYFDVSVDYLVGQTDKPKINV